MLDLQVRLKDESGARRSMDSLAVRLPAGGPLRNEFDFQISGALAGAWYRLGQPAKAAEAWKKLREQARTEETALAVFQSYRQVQLLDECLDWAREQRRTRGLPQLWALEVAQLHEDAGRWNEAFDELAAWQCARRSPGRLVDMRLLRLAESCRERGPLLEYMVKRVRGRGGCAAVGQAVLGVLTQQGRPEQAIKLAWELDSADTGRIPFELAQDLGKDGRRQESQTLLEELARRGRPQPAQPEGLLLQADNLAALGRGEEAMVLYRRLAERSDSKGLSARLKAAQLLHRPLGRPEEAIQELELLLQLQPGHPEGGRLLLLLLGSQGHAERAAEVLETLQNRARVNEEERADLAFLALRLEWWTGQLTPCGRSLGAFLQTSTRQETFNDAIDLADLLAFTTRDSLCVAEAARADRLAFAGSWREALELLHSLAEGRPDKLTEWLDWRACQLAQAELDATGLRRELERFQLRHPASVRLDRLAWMDLLAAEREGRPRDELRRQALSLLETWPGSLLQDAVRRRLREWEPADAAPPAAPDPAEPLRDERPR